jgi:hypothetical protein
MATNQPYDPPWKKILSVFFRPALELCFPAIAADIDWEKGCEFLDKEFEQIVRQSETGSRYVDKLAKVWRNNGSEQWVLLHVEVQVQWEADLARRLFDYYSRIRQRYDRPVATIVILADEHSQWRPSAYESEIWGCKIKLEYPVTKLLDLAVDEAKLLENPNPFAIVVLAHVQSLRTRKDAGQQYYWKKRLTQLGYERGYTRDQILDLFTFIDWVIVLPEELSTKFDAEMTKFETERRMEYITSTERRGIEKGRLEGMQQGMQQGIQKGQIETLRENILDILNARFDLVPYTVNETIKGITDVSRLKSLVRQASTTPSTADFLKLFSAAN